MSDELYYVMNPSISLRTFDDGAVIFDAEGSKEHFLNSVGFFIFKMLDGATKLEEIAQAVAKNFECNDPQELTLDVKSFISELADGGFVTITPDKSYMPQNKEFQHFNDAPFKIDLSLTGKCNLNCPFCFYADEMQNFLSNGDLDTQIWIKFIDELGELAVREVTLSGGEIFLRADLFQIIDVIIKNKMRFSILTNGTLINDEIIAKLSEQNRKKRLRYVQVSIDGSCAEIHEKIRGKGTFEKTISALRKLLNAGLPVTARVTINQHNYQDLEGTSRLLLEDLKLPSFSTNETAMIGAGLCNQDSVVLTANQKLFAMKKITELAEKYNGRITSLAGPLTDAKMYAEMRYAKETGIKAKRWKMGYLSACGCVFNNLNVNFDGTITPCVMLSDIKLGKINQNSIKEIWQKHPVLLKMRERSEIHIKSIKGCENCSWSDICNGGCPGVSFAMTGDINSANMQFCYRKFIEEITDDTK